MRTLKKEDVEITLHCEVEHESVRGNAMASGDDAQDRECEEWILGQLRDGNEWAWCAVTVRATWTAPSGREYRGEDRLGCCSYESERDFVRDGYYTGMVDGAIADLNASLARIGEDLAVL